MNKRSRSSKEVRERAVRLVLSSEWFDLLGGYSIEPLAFTVFNRYFDFFTSLCFYE